MYKVSLKLDKFFLKCEGGRRGGRGSSWLPLPPPTPGKTTFKKPSLIRVKKEKICKEAVCREPYALKHVPDWFKTQEMCEKAVEKAPWLLYNVPDWSVVLQEMWCEDFDDNDYLIRWPNAYQKRKAQKASIKEGLLPIAWHPSRWWDWCTSEGEKKETEKL